MSFLGIGDTPKINAKPSGFNAGGFMMQPGSLGGPDSLVPTAERSGLVTNIGDLYGQQGDLLGGLRSTVGPGMNDMLKARLAQINDSANSAIGNLRQNLDSRRVLGSSFGQDTLSRAGAEFSRQRDQATADNFMKSLDINQQLITHEYQARRSQFQTGLDELNLESGIASQFNSTANKLMADAASAQANLDAKSATGAGSFFGGLAQKFGGPIASKLGSMFGGTATAAGAAAGEGATIMGMTPEALAAAGVFMV